VYLPLLAAVLGQRGELDVFDVSEMAGCDAWTAEAALQELAAAGLAAQDGQCRYRSLHVTGTAGEPAGPARDNAGTPRAPGQQ